ncbi:MAG TPA: preprotein translocase subunit SecE [Nitrospirota bacterium]|jgi:preprotein translocase subunit SecE
MLVYVAGENIMLNNAIEFLKESRNELGRVVFPSRQEVIGATAVVILSVVVVSVFLGVVDAGLSAMMKALIK